MKNNTLYISCVFLSALAFACNERVSYVQDFPSPCNGTCPEGQICNTETDSCEPSGYECITKFDCSKGSICQDRACVPGCDDSDDCDGTQVCRNNQCGPECRTSKDCKDNRICREQTCVIQCREDDDCKDYLVCRDNICTTECRKDSDCSNGLICLEHRCVNECESNDECSQERICENNRCILECKSDTDCADTLICRQNRCTPQCGNDDDCGDHYLCKKQICSPECEISDDCTDDLICKNQMCVPECTQDSDCENEQLCDDSRCVHCIVDLDCGDGLFCRNHACLPECVSKEDCPSEAFECTDNHCVISCETNLDCPEYRLCEHNICVPECTSDDDCDGLFCSNEHCVSCLSDEDCPADYRCFNDGCYLKYDVRNVCIITKDGTDVFRKSDEEFYNETVNPDGSVNLCTLGYLQSDADLMQGEDRKCVPLFSKPREFDFYGDGIDSNCDGYDYDLSSAVFINSYESAPVKKCIDLYCGEPIPPLDCIEYTPTQHCEDIFLAEGNDEHSGLYDSQADLIKPLYSLEAALNKTVKIKKNDQEYEISPDILMAGGNYEYNKTIHIPTYQDEIFNQITSYPDLSSLTYQSRFAFHQALIQKITDDPSFEPFTVRFYNEFEMPNASVRIYGGLAFKDDLKSVYVNDAAHTQVNIAIEHPENESYIAGLLPKKIDTPLSLALSHIDFSVKASPSYTVPDRGITTIGLSCGIKGCRYLALDHVLFDIAAPDGRDYFQANGNELKAEKGNNGIELQTCMDVNSSQFGLRNCQTAQTCHGQKMGKGGCGGLLVLHNNVAIVNDRSGQKGDYGQPAYGQSYPTQAGGSENVDGFNGVRGNNGDNSQQVQTLAVSSDNNAVSLNSNYDEDATIHGQYGAQGGGGMGSSIYQTIITSDNPDYSFSAASGGNGGCGGDGGKAGGSGSSAVGLELFSPDSDDSTLSMDNVSLSIHAGSGGRGQAGESGGDGGNGVKGIFLLSKDSGAGGKGGGGGAGAGGIAGQAVAFLLSCSREVSENCSSEKPCFTPNNRLTLKNCGFNLPPALVLKTADEQIADLFRGRSYTNQFPDVENNQLGALPNTSQTVPGNSEFIKTWIH